MSIVAKRTGVAVGETPRPLDATIAAMKRKNFADFLRKSFLVKIFAHSPPGGNARAFHPGWRYHAVSGGTASVGR